MTTFVDTSALYALLDEDDDNHGSAVSWLSSAGSDSSEILLTHSYVVVEAAALVHRRLGTAAVRVLFDAFFPALSVIVVGEDLHGRAAAAYLAGLGTSVSLVDRVSFQLMREAGLDRAFAFDRDFTREGFQAFP